MAGLNFLICLLLRDKSNTFGLWSMVPELEQNFLSLLATGLSLSRAHYNLKLNDPSSTEVTFMVGGQPLPNMSQEQMKEVVKSALNTFGMMECVMCQLNNVIANKPKF